MKLEMIGLNHTTSTLATRERATILPERIKEVSGLLLRQPHVEGVVILSTCNRVEIYLSPSYHFTDDKLRSIFAEACGLTILEVEDAYIFRDDQAALHLFRTASGLDSQMLGEVQILAQVKAAYHTALVLATSNAFLNRVFLRAIECGKMVRHRTAISQGAVSVAYAAVDLAHRVFGELQERNVLLIGAGATIQLAAKHLTDAGINHWRISNRSIDKAESLAESVNGDICAFPPTPEDIAWADVVVSATSAPDFVLPSELTEQAIAHRKRTILLLDLAVPRDIEPPGNGFENAYFYSVDDFQEMVNANLKTREHEAVRADKLVQYEVAEFVTWYQENRIAPTIQQLQEVLEGIRSAEVENNARRFCREDREQVEKFSKSLMKKVAGHLIANLKHACVNKNDLSLAKAVTMAFAPADESSVTEVIERLNHELSH